MKHILYIVAQYVVVLLPLEIKLTRTPHHI